VEDYPKTISEFEERFATEEACREYLAALRWPEGFRCPRCGCGQAWLTKRGLYQCRQCDFQVSLTAGTIFQDTRKPLIQWFRAMWYVTSQKYGVSALGLQRFLGLGSYHTAWTWLHKLRHAMVRPGRDRLRGVVEVDETYVGAERSGKCGRGAQGKEVVMIAVEDTGVAMGRIRMCLLPNASILTLTAALQGCVEPGSVIRTDGWSGYNDLRTVGYTHTVVRSGSVEGTNLLPLAHRVTSLLKRWMLGTHQGAIRPSHLPYYLDEFTFRFNRRTSRSRGKLFFRLLQQSVAFHPVTANEIKGGRPKQENLKHKM
jgi:transposase-like protein